jgi:hypothetical protein
MVFKLQIRPKRIYMDGRLDRLERMLAAAHADAYLTRRRNVNPSIRPPEGRCRDQAMNMPNGMVGTTCQ